MPLITFPRDMPSVGAMAVGFEPQRQDFMSIAGGRVFAVTAGFALWKMDVDLNAMRFEASDIWRAWHAVQRGPQNPFYARDLDRPFPAAHASGFSRMTKVDGSPFTGTAGGWSQVIAANGVAELTLTGVPSGLRLSLGDYVGFRWSELGRSLVRAVLPARADATGSITVAVEPPVPTITPAHATAYLDKPCCLMRLVTEETKLARQLLGYTEAGGKIVGVQDLRA